MIEEIWVDSPSIKDLRVSSFGRVCLKPYTLTMPKGGKKNITPKPTFGILQKKGENYNIFVFLNKKRKINKKVHQLICEAFHGLKPSEASVVMHLDNNPENNKSYNLKWGSQKENLNTPEYIEYCKTRVGIFSPRVKGLKN